MFRRGVSLNMASSPDAFKAMSKYPVLPPIAGSQQPEEPLAAVELVQKLRSQKKLLRHRRSKVQQEQMQKILCVILQK